MFLRGEDFGGVDSRDTRLSDEEDVESESKDTFPSNWTMIELSGIIEWSGDAEVLKLGSERKHSPLVSFPKVVSKLEQLYNLSGEKHQDH